MQPVQPPTIEESAALANRVRARVVQMSNAGHAAHLAGALSCVDILVALYWHVLRIDPRQPDAPNRDRFLFSKGHASSALYAVLAERGFFPGEWLSTYAQNGSRLAEQMAPRCAPGVEAATGSLGHGLPLGNGMALAARVNGDDYGVWVLLSDGECNEGSVWEAAMFAAGQKLGNLNVLVDFNRWQATGRSDEVLALQPLKQKWEAFGFHAAHVDGHDIPALLEAMRQAQRAAQPAAVIADTVKGKGVSFMEDDNNWHYRIPTDAEVRQALRELGQT
ncbi:MAG: transketolase [Planctomycetaceae bacterium]